MSQRLFSVTKVGLFLDSYAPGIEKRRGEEVSVITLKLRCQPFDATLASALDSGVGGDSNIRATVFSLNTTDPKPNFTRHDFKLSLERQNLIVFATPDTTEPSIALAQAKISGTYVRVQKDMNALAFVLKATLGPVGRNELEFIHAWHRSQKFVSFEEAEPLMEFEDDGDDEGLTDADEKAQTVARREPMWDDDDEPSPSEVATVEAKREVGARQRLHSHAAKRKTSGKRKATGQDARA